MGLIYLTQQVYLSEHFRLTIGVWIIKEVSANNSALYIQ